MTKTNSEELNLRSIRVQGGIYTLDLLKVPPQPCIVADCTITQGKSIINMLANYLTKLLII